MSIALVAHSGGPTAVINASLFGVWKEVQLHRRISALYGARFGIEGILKEQLVDLSAQPIHLMQAISHAPASALGTSRREVLEPDIERVVDALKAHGVRFFFYNGGNGSMGTASQIEAVARDQNYELSVVGIPKTIDNDLFETDHSPGYASAARFFASAVRAIGMDNAALPAQVEIVEILGRNAGWLAAATSLARRNPEDPPHLIYLPERPLPLAKLYADVEGVFRRLGRCVVAVCEGQLDDGGEPFGADVRSGSRGSLAMNLAHRLALLISRELGIRARSEKPGLLGRACASMASDIDRREADLVGREAVRLAVAGQGGSMVTIIRQPDLPYGVEFGSASLSSVAYRERLFPEAWIAPGGVDVTADFREYALPLVGSIDKYESLADLPAPKRLS